MKQSILFLSALLFASNASAFSATCKSYDTFSGEEYETSSSHLGIGTLSGYECRSNKNEKLYIALPGIGPGLRADLGNVINITCPLINHRRLMKRLQTGKLLTLFGPEVTASAIVGAKVGFL